MKTLLLLIIPFIVFASGKMMSNADYLYFSGIDKQPFAQKNEKARLYAIDKIGEKKALSLTKELTTEDAMSLKLTHRGRYLIYKITTQTYRVILNALDGTVIGKEPK
jgi:hypothetical protein